MTDDFKTEFALLFGDIKERLNLAREFGVEGLNVDVTSNNSTLSSHIGKISNVTEFRQPEKSEYTLPPKIETVKPKVALPQTTARMSFADKLNASKLSNIKSEIKASTEISRNNIKNEEPQVKQMPTKESADLSNSLFGDLTPDAKSVLPETTETLEIIRNEIGDCIRCPLATGRTQIVHSEGNLKARVMFVGEAPGADEDAQGHPFIGRAGQLLTKIIEAIGLKREEVFIGNINRCRPPQNRTPTIQEARTCRPYLWREIAVVRPEILVVMGNTATQNLLDTKEGITKIRGRFKDFQGVKVMPTFHPAYLLRDPSKKRETWEDMKIVRDELAKTAS